MVKVSIIVPVYNSKNYIKKCIESILIQDLKEFEIIIIDDGSSDGSSEICDKLSEKDKRIKVFHRENGGICEARNYGLMQAQGEYIAFSDHDDIVKQGFLSNNYSLAKKYDADIVKFGRIAYWIKDEKTISKKERNFNFRVINKEEIKQEFLYFRFKEIFSCVWDGMFKREFLKNNNLIFNKFYKKGGEDIEFCSNCFLYANTVVFNNKIYYEHYIRLGYSTSTKFDDEKLKRNEMLSNNLKKCMKKLGIVENIDNKEMYIFNIVKENVYSSICYLLNNKVGYKRINCCLEKIYSSYVEKDIKIDMNFKFFRIRFISWLFLRKKFKMLYTLVKWYKKYNRR